jgi:hypothetical protein
VSSSHGHTENPKTGQGNLTTCPQLLAGSDQSLVQHVFHNRSGTTCLCCNRCHKIRLCHLTTFSTWFAEPAFHFLTPQTLETNQRRDASGDDPVRQMEERQVNVTHFSDFCKSPEG